MKKDFELVAHTADVQIRVYGDSLEQLFCNALIGMFQVSEPVAQGCVQKHNRLVCKKLSSMRELLVQASTVESLLVDFLSYALYLSDVHNEAYLDVIIKEFSDTRIYALLKGVPVERFDGVEIKAVTYHNLNIERKGNYWKTDIVFDI